ncbi:hypothetical protein LX69_03510 [Breznakibacter xylanolyticus]|uniref:Uncharacterized protein n=1 Tax=Breznakibacter xylanolyticus TaxID=990 RepID=A0A2W7NET7_9BACT|nr:hypothetical protein LX69_03510 [Breznakibacter xylanolyticus]
MSVWWAFLRKVFFVHELHELHELIPRIEGNSRLGIAEWVFVVDNEERGFEGVSECLMV